MGEWASHEPDSELTRSPPSRAERIAEQDAAAGGRERRQVHLPDGGLATASVSLSKTKNGRRIYAYVRYKTGGKTVQRYAGDTSPATSRRDALAAGWRLVHEKGLLDPS